jgi:hypothetical protein
MHGIIGSDASADIGASPAIASSTSFRRLRLNAPLILAPHGRSDYFASHFAAVKRELADGFYYRVSLPVPAIAEGGWGQAIIRTPGTAGVDARSEVAAAINPNAEFGEVLAAIRKAAKTAPDPATVPDYVTAITVFDHGKYGKKAVKLYPDFPKTADAERFSLYFPPGNAALVQSWMGERADARVSVKYGILEFSADGGPLRPAQSRAQAPAAAPESGPAA